MSCPIIIDQPMINEIITENPVLEQLLDDRYITIKSLIKLLILILKIKTIGVMK